MRVWDLPPAGLCRAHLLGEHRELHAVWTVLTEGKRGYARHPETLRWRGRLRALYDRHESLVREMTRRGWRHASPLDRRKASGRASQDRYVNSPREQVELLKRKGCGCSFRAGAAVRRRAGSPRRSGSAT